MGSLWWSRQERMAAFYGIFFLLLINFTFSQLSFKRGEEFTHKVRGRFLNFNRCCNNAERYCKRPCAGRPCDSQCRVQCGFLSGLCPAVSCQAANPAQCSGGGGGGGGGGGRCEAGYTEVGSKCMTLVPGPANYLSAILGCERRGAVLASVTSQQLDIGRTKNVVRSNKIVFA